jgi:regulator of replication initiation timing
MMDRRSLYDGLNQLEVDMQKNLEDLVSMKETLLELVEKMPHWKWKMNACVNGFVRLMPKNLQS